MSRLLVALPHLPPAPARRSSVRPWKVIHAVEDATRALPLATAQADAGMFPALLTPAGWLRPGACVEAEASSPSSLLRQWQQVRRWRHVLASEDVRRVADVLHAHCLAAATASLRDSFALVYDVVLPAELAGAAAAKPCALRSLALPETLILRKAAAVVVHSRAMWNWALRRGASVADLYLVPEPVELSALGPSAPAQSDSRVTFFAPAVEDAPSLELLLRAFSILAGEIEGAALLLETPPDVESIVAARAAALQVGTRVRSIAPSEREQTFACADVIIAGGIHDEGPNSAAIQAFSYGHALLAADVATNREVTPNGRGCLWFRPDSPRDLAFRAAFLARNPDLRAALGRSGRAHLEATRGPRAVAEAYDEVYQHALARHGHGAHPGLLAEVPALQLG